MPPATDLHWRHVDVVKTIHKYPIALKGNNAVDLPNGAVFRHFGTDGQGRLKFWMWFEVETAEELMSRSFRIVATGDEIPKRTVYRGTVVVPPFVWHLFEDY